MYESQSVHLRFWPLFYGILQTVNLAQFVSLQLTTVAELRSAYCRQAYCTYITVDLIIQPNDIVLKMFKL